jgi:hypothetical protein
MVEPDITKLKAIVETYEKELKDQINAFAFFGNRIGPKEKDHVALAGLVIDNSVKVIELNNKLLTAYRNYTKALEVLSAR